MQHSNREFVENKYQKPPQFSCAYIQPKLVTFIEHFSILNLIQTLDMQVRSYNIKYVLSLRKESQSFIMWSHMIQFEGSFIILMHLNLELLFFITSADLQKDIKLCRFLHDLNICINNFLKLVWNQRV